IGAVDWQGFRWGVVADLLARDAEAVRALLLDAARVLFADGCPCVSCQCLDPRPWARRAFLRSGFLLSGAAANIVCGSLSARAGGSPERREAWYLTHGDTDLV